MTMKSIPTGTPNFDVSDAQLKILLQSEESADACFMRDGQRSCRVWLDRIKMLIRNSLLTSIKCFITEYLSFILGHCTAL